MPLVRPRSVPIADLRVGVSLAGAIDGVNATFTAPDLFRQDPPGDSIAVYLNGIRQELGGDYTVAGSGPVGTGEEVTFLEPPRPGDKIAADYSAV